ncbi:hypothetical protein DPMN_134253 [Dreissena polymorpha]|uniref:Uncharacterized protein n=1 Tax=Dreissena polymorpha TaxID=45954 RepID=A0A9D4FVW6_DREPO|nr:hypothetical protein DPMN_134253 [Dreissena polymorpha]
MQACEGCGISIANASEGCLQRAAAFFSSIIFVEDLFWPADLEDILETDVDVDEDLYFLDGDGSDSPGLCSIDFASRWY